MNLFLFINLKYFILFIVADLIFSFVISHGSLYAQINLTVLNSSFEQPDSGKIIGFDGKSGNPGTDFKLIDIPDWQTTDKDSSNWDSGIEKIATTDGEYAAFLMSRDSAVYQILNSRINKGDNLNLTVDAWVNSFDGKLKMEVFYLDGDTANSPWIPLMSEIKELTGTADTYSITAYTYKIQQAAGHKIGILFDNVSSDSSSLLYIDNIKLSNTDPTIIPVNNFSFELPDSGLIIGWNGLHTASDSAESYADIPGWMSDDNVNDSGIEGRGMFNPPEGQYVGFLDSKDTSVFNTTEYAAQGGDEITLKVFAYKLTPAAELHLEIYYLNDSGEKVAVNSANQVLKPGWNQYSLVAEVAWDQKRFGHKLGILLNNVNSDSIILIDDIRLSANHTVETSVPHTRINPVSFSLAQNYPNPFNPSTKISYSINEQSKVRLTVFDITGREVAVLVNEEQIPGNYIVSFTAVNFSSSVYFYRLQAAGRIITKKMIILK